MILQIRIDVSGKILRYPIGRVAHGHARVEILEESLAQFRIAAVRHDIEYRGTADMPEKGTDRCDLFRQSCLAGVRKNFERKRARRFDLRQNAQGSAIESADGPAFRASEMVAVVWHASA